MPQRKPSHLLLSLADTLQLGCSVFYYTLFFFALFSFPKPVNNGLTLSFFLSFFHSFSFFSAGDGQETGAEQRLN